MQARRRGIGDVASCQKGEMRDAKKRAEVRADARRCAKARTDVQKRAEGVRRRMKLAE